MVLHWQTHTYNDCQVTNTHTHTHTHTQTHTLYTDIHCTLGVLLCICIYFTLSFFPFFFKPISLSLPTSYPSTPLSIPSSFLPQSGVSPMLLLQSFILCLSLPMIHHSSISLSYALVIMRCTYVHISLNVLHYLLMAAVIRVHQL